MIPGILLKILGGLLVTFGFYLTFAKVTISKVISPSEIQVKLLNYNYVIVMSLAAGLFLILWSDK